MASELSPIRDSLAHFNTLLSEKIAKEPDRISKAKELVHFDTEIARDYHLLSSNKKLLKKNWQILDTTASYAIALVVLFGINDDQANDPNSTKLMEDYCFILDYPEGNAYRASLVTEIMLEFRGAEQSLAFILNILPLYISNANPKTEKILADILERVLSRLTGKETGLPELLLCIMKKDSLAEVAIRKIKKKENFSLVIANLAFEIDDIAKLLQFCERTGDFFCEVSIYERLITCSEKMKSLQELEIQKDSSLQLLPLQFVDLGQAIVQQEIYDFLHYPESFKSITKYPRVIARICLFLSVLYVHGCESALGFLIKHLKLSNNDIKRILIKGSEQFFRIDSRLRLASFLKREDERLLYSLKSRDGLAKIWPKKVQQVIKETLSGPLANLLLSNISKHKNLLHCLLTHPELENFILNENLHWQAVAKASTHSKKYFDYICFFMAIERKHEKNPPATENEKRLYAD